MVSLLSHLSQSWLDGTVRTLEGLRRGMSEPFPLTEDPPPTTPYEVVYEEGKVRVRHYRSAGRALATPLLVVYSLIKRPFILDLQHGRSVVETLTKQGIEVYFLDWIPPTRTDSWRGFDAYINDDLAHAVRAIQIREQVKQVSLLGYCFGGLLSTIYAALYPKTVKSLVTLASPFDMGVREYPTYSFLDKLTPETLDLITAVYGNCPAWLIKVGFDAMDPVHHALNKFVGLYRNKDRDGYGEMFNRFEQWMNSDVPLAGKIFRETVEELFQKNALVHERFHINGRQVNLKQITSSVLNIVAENDDVVHPKSSLPLIESIGSKDTQNLLFPTGHVGASVSAAAHKQLWPQACAWLKERDSKWTH
jgi:polyhydroxyalkanoate synthase